MTSDPNLDDRPPAPEQDGVPWGTAALLAMVATALVVAFVGV